MNKRQKERLKKQVIVIINAILGFSIGACYGAIIVLFLIVGFEISPQNEVLFYLECFGIPGVPGLITMYANIKDDLYIFKSEW